MDLDKMSKSISLERLLSYVVEDPLNRSLLQYAADQAYNEGNVVIAGKLVKQYEELGPLPDALASLKGLIAMREREWIEGAQVFRELIFRQPDDPTLCVNLAWCLSMTGNFSEAETYLSERTVRTVRGAANLKLRALHHLGHLDDGVELGLRLLSDPPPEDPNLWGALAVLAFDAEEIALAEKAARLAPDTEDAAAALGMLSLQKDALPDAQAQFDRALAVNSTSARALLGKGLAILAAGQIAEATPWLDRAAEVFKTHLGSWVAAGWAHFLKGDISSAKARFETALAIDDTFAEIHGGLAVIDLVEGRISDARRRADIAVRLDRRSFSAALAVSLISEQSGDSETARRIQFLALNSPIDTAGATLASMILRASRENRLPRKFNASSLPQGPRNP